MNDSQQRLIATVNAALGTEAVSLNKLSETVILCSHFVAPDISQEDLEYCIDYLSRTRIIVIRDSDPLLKAGHESWLPDRKSSIDWTRWEAYRTLLSNKNMPPLVIDTMHTRNESLLDLAGDPLKEGMWDRRGLVIGDVQSGKTANYLALFNKAADAGYKVFILLAGSTNKLRQQTQERVDEGFIGIDTRTLALGRGNAGLQGQKKIGIGLLSQSIRTNSQTNFDRDFSTAAAGAIVHLSGDGIPTVFVVKKNKTVLKNLGEWLATSAGQNQKIKVPMLLLDDEADYASINTNPTQDEATAINEGIRKLLQKFEKSSYIGFTATPFANVLIDDEPNDDLFPKDFILNLESPSNYFGPRKMVTEEGVPNKFLVNIADAEAILPFKHSSSHIVSGLPNSLVESVRVFFLTNAIRDLRQGQHSQARSMLVNVSRFVKVQKDVHDKLSTLVAETKDRLRYERETSSAEWAKLHASFLKFFPDIDESWDQVKILVPQSIEGISVQLVNSSNATADWESIYRSPNPRVIAVGGDVLSRGLTLEGLSTSYFYRKSLAYDTLMQMGRWFGYRDGYEDLCRLWIDEDVASWYGDIADALDELRSDLKTMATLGREPKDFGLAVRCHPGSMLTVTARNKARAARIQPREINVSEIDEETPKLRPDTETINKNWETLSKFIAGMADSSLIPSRPKGVSGKALWNDVPQALVGTFLAEFVPAPTDLYFGDTSTGQGGAIANFALSNVSPELQVWDVSLMSGEGSPIPGLLGGLASVQRDVKINPTTKLLSVGGNSQRLGGRSDLGITLSQAQLGELAQIKIETGKDAAAHEFRRRLAKPLLLIYPIVPKEPKPPVQSQVEWETYVPAAADKPLVGIHVAFPKRDPSNPNQPKIVYMVNRVWQRIEEVSVNPVDDQEMGQIDEDR